MPLNGEVTFEADGSFTYQHNGTETATDSFTYTIEDAAGVTRTATVNISINSQNDAPVAADEQYNGDEGGTITATVATGVLANDSDPDGDNLTVTVDVDPENGTLVLNPNGSFTYTHNGSETTSDFFTYTVDDGNGGTTTARVDLTIAPVNNAPIVTDGAVARIASEGNGNVVFTDSVVTDVDSADFNVIVLTTGSLIGVVVVLNFLQFVPREIVESQLTV